MPEIKYKDIADLDINPVPINILHADSQLAKVMAMQCNGQINTDGKVDNSDALLATEKHTNFFDLAVMKKADLAVTPEYSCPWNVIETVLTTPGKLPAPGALWVIGCESITPKTLDEIKSRTEKFAIWEYEDVKPNANTNQVFVSPVVYIFRLANESGDNKPDVGIIVQFKFHDMGGAFERDKLIKGNTRYILHNPGEDKSIRLLTIICADAFVFNISDINASHPYLLIHIQLNLNPYHHNCKAYRMTMFQTEGNTNNYEVFCLNWAKGFEIEGTGISEDHGGSAYYMNPPEETKEPQQDDDTINTNHDKGIYLRFSSESRYSAFFLTPQEAVFEFNTTKVSQIESPPVNQLRTGIIANETYEWSRDNKAWEATHQIINDKVNELYEKFGGVNNDIPTNREKLLSLCVGKVGKDRIKWHMPGDLDGRHKRMLGPTYWHKARNMDSFHLDTGEKPQGTLACLHSEQNIEIHKTLSQFTNLRACLSDKENLPNVFYDYKSNNTVIELGDEELQNKEIRHNVRLESGGGLATAVDLGATTKSEAKKAYNEIKDLLSPNRLVVWYMFEGKNIPYTDELKSISEAQESTEDITRE